ncbi:MAG: serine/threonine-protein kinase [bacterium]
MSVDPPDTPPGTPPTQSASPEEAAKREAAARALAESGLGSGLLARQSVSSEEESVPVLKICPQCSTEYETALRFCPNDGTALRPKGTDTLVGRVLADRYHILKKIGEGGMGRVYLGEHVKMNRQCAIKVMSPALVNDHESAARFAREASNAARIIHPNVAAVFDYGESDGVVYLVMEYVDGEPLSQLLQRDAPFTVERTLDIATQIADALTAAHELGIVHRDLKPDNILLSRSRTGREVVKVVDFGIAKAMQESAGEALTRTGLVIGTPEFMSPEQLLGDPIDARSDLYAVGCMMHMMLTATPPFEATTREQMIKRRLSEDAPSIHTLDPSIPASVSTIVQRLLARSPHDRMGSAAELHDAVTNTHIRRPGLGSVMPKGFRPTPRSAPTVAFLQATQATTEVTHIPSPGITRRVPYVIGGVVLVGLAAGAFMLQQNNARVANLAARALADSVARDSVRRDSIAQAVAKHSADSAASATPSAVAPTVMAAALDSGQAARQHARDSLARTATADSNSARGTVIAYAKAVESGDIAKVRASYPMSKELQDFWDGIYAQGEAIRTTLRYDAMTLGENSAEVRFTLTVKFVNKNISLPPRKFEMTVGGQGSRSKVSSLR